MEGPFIVRTGADTWTVYARCYLGWHGPDFVSPLGTYATEAEARAA